MSTFAPRRRPVTHWTRPGPGWCCRSPVWRGRGRCCMDCLDDDGWWVDELAVPDPDGFSVLLNLAEVDLARRAQLARG